MRQCLAACAAALAAMLPPLAAQAQGADVYPSRNLTMVVASAPGGTSDLIGRLLADHLSKRLGRSVIVENKPGAGSIVGAEYLARSKPDGYTIGVIAVNTHGIGPSINKNVSYDHIKDFTPISLVSTYPNILVVGPNIAARTVPELIALLKKEPGKHTFASSGQGSSLHMSGELFAYATGTKMIHVPYKGSGPMVTDLLAGHVDLSFDNIPSSLPHVKARKLHALGVTSAKRLPTEPDIPAVSEYIPGFEANSWHGLAGPAGIPPAIVARLSREVAATMREPAVRDQIVRLGGVAIGSTPEEFAAHIRAETDKWAKVVEAAGIKPE